MSEREKRVCLDPGHDAGNLANKSPDGTYYEHAFTLDLGKRLEKLLTDRGVSVTMTRTGGGAVSLARRCEIANSIPDLDLFVSLHSNAAAGGGWSSAKGWSVYLYGPGGDRERAAQDILEQVRAAGIAVRSTPIVYDPELYVLKHTKAPAVLLENGFHTNREEAALLGQADYRQKLAVAEAKGILEYLGIPWVETEEETDYQAEARAAVDWLTENGIMQGNSVEILRESGTQGACRFGVHVTLGETRLAGILAHLAEALPEITVRASIHNSRETERMILQNELDFAVVDNVTVSPHYLVEPLCGEELAAVCAPGYLEGKNSLTLAELAEERLLLRERGSGTRNSVDAGLQGAGATAQPVVESVSTAALLACARAGLGITLLPRSLVVTDLERGDLRELAVEDGGFHRSYFLVRHRSKYLTDGMKRVIRVLREHLGGEQP